MFFRRIKQLEKETEELNLRLKKVELLQNKPDLEIGKDVYRDNYDGNNYGNLLEVKLVLKPKSLFCPAHYNWDAFTYLDGKINQISACSLTHEKPKKYDGLVTELK